MTGGQGHEFGAGLTPLNVAKLRKPPVGTCSIQAYTQCKKLAALSNAISRLLALRAESENRGAFKHPRAQWVGGYLSHPIENTEKEGGVVEIPLLSQTYVRLGCTASTPGLELGG